MNHAPFAYDTLAQLREDITAKGVSIPVADGVDALKKPLKIGDKTVNNRLLVQPIEGFDALPDGSPSQRCIDRYCAFVRGGAGVIWLESVSVSGPGRSNPHQLWITEENAPQFRALHQAMVAAQDPENPVYTVIQLTHSGRYSNPGTPAPVCAFHSDAIPKDNATIITDEEVVTLEQDYIKAAVLARQCGFDAVDLRACHGYLINEFFSAYDRPGNYGGSFENRTRLMRNVVSGVKAACDADLAVRLNMYDGVPHPYGWGCDREDVTKLDLTEPLELVAWLYQAGVKMFNTSGGVGPYSPHVIRPYDKGGPIPGEHPLEGVARQLSFAKAVKERVPDAVVVASALTWLRQFGGNVAAGGVEEGWCDLAGFGRLALKNLDFAREMLAGTLESDRCCTTCGGCTALIKVSGKQLRCVTNG